MIVLNLSEVSMSFGTDVILNKITFGLNGGDRLGVVGVNGAGKSLLFKIISGKVRCDSGSVNFSKDLKVAYLEQNASFESKNPIFDEMLLAFPQLVKDEERLEWLQNEMLSFSEENEETHTIHHHGNGNDAVVDGCTCVCGGGYRTRYSGHRPNCGWPKNGVFYSA